MWIDKKLLEVEWTEQNCFPKYNSELTENGYVLYRFHLYDILEKKEQIYGCFGGGTRYEWNLTG